VLATTTFSYSSNVAVCPAATEPDAKSIGTTTVTNPTGQTTVYCWDADRRVTKISDPAVSSSTTWNGSDLPATITTPGGTTSNEYYPGGLLLKETTDPTGAKTKFEYGSTSAPHDPTKVTDPQGVVTHYAYDTAGNRCLVRHDRAPQGTDLCADTTGAFVRLVHNADGTLASTTDAKGNTTTYGYDTLGRLTSITPPSPLGTETRTYDGLSRLATVTDGKSQTTSFTYDDLDRITLVEHHDGSQVSYTYDDNGNMLTETDAGGTTTYVYDRLGRLTTETPPTGPQVTYAYDKAGNLTSITDGGGMVTYQYTGTTGRLSGLTQPDSSQITFGYDAQGNRNQVSYPNGVTVDSVFDGAAKPTSILAKKGSTTLASFAYGYADSQSQPTNVIQSVTDENGSVTRYSYTTPGRLVRARTTASGGAVTADFQYGYDAAGNRTSQDLDGTQTTFSYNAGNQLTQGGSTTYSYDQNGNLTGDSAGSVLSYNAANQTTGITPAGGSSVAMSYRGTGQTDRTSAGSTQMRLSGLGVSGATDASGSTYYTRTPDGGILAQRAPSGTHYMVRDAIGSVVALTDGSGATASRFSYDPFGREISATGSVATPWRFAGEYLDASTGLYKIGERFYDPTLGRWTQQDAIFDAASFTQSNRYLYVGADPLNFFDPEGMSCKNRVLKVACDAGNKAKAGAKAAGSAIKTGAKAAASKAGTAAKVAVKTAVKIIPHAKVVACSIGFISSVTAAHAAGERRHGALLAYGAAGCIGVMAGVP
jgi:RHS repeat-associated protein